MLKMMEGFLKRDEIKYANAGTHRERLEALREGKVKAASLQEPWISVAEAKGCRVLIESRSTRSEAAGDELDGATLAKMFRAEARAAEAINENPAKYAHYLLEEAGGVIELRDLKLSRMLNAPPVPYTRERFNDNYQWTLSWNLVPPGATYENTVDNRAWQ
jgi:NitT/TauT family transport system substrate-binding protein